LAPSMNSAILLEAGDIQSSHKAVSGRLFGTVASAAHLRHDAAQARGCL
jgi:hypothetical protein